MSRATATDLAAAAVLAALYLAWGSLLMANPDRFCVSDCHLEILPRLIAVARAFQQGSLALWDANTMAGAKPFWMSTSSIYYPPLLPLYWLTDPEDPRRSTELLQIFPYVAHVFLSALGGFVFARRILGLVPLAAMVVGVVYSFAPAMLTTISFVNYAQGFSYLPWITLVAIHTLDSGSRRAWAVGALLGGLMCSATNPDQVSRTLLAVGMQVAGYWLVTRRGRPWRDRDIVRLMLLLPMVLFGMATYAFGFAGVFQGISMALSTLEVTCESAANFAEYSSMPPTSLLTLFFPPGFVHFPELSNVGAGALTLSAATTAIVLAFRGDAQWQWTCVAGGVATLLLLLVLGKHTPFYGLACELVPICFRFPHPINYTFGVSWGIALLAGLGIDAVARHPPSRSVLLLCGWPLFGALIVYGVHPDIRSFRWMMNPIGASAYIGAAGLLLLAIICLPARRWGSAIALAVLCESMASGFHLGLNLPSNPNVDWFDHTQWSNAHSLLADLPPVLRRLAESDEVRFVGTRSAIDNQAWLANARSLFGMSVKPTLPRFEQAFLRFTRNAPYELWLVGLPQFLSNMNVGILIADREPTYHEYLSRDHADFDGAVGRLPLLGQTASFDIRQLPEPMPYVYTQHRIEIATAEQQLERLLGNDLRQAAYVSEECAREAPPGMPPFPSPQGSSSAFAELQTANKIVRFDRSNPNRKEIRIDVGRAAMLIVADNWHSGWRAKLDGRSVRVWDVNYLQQGIWLPQGPHIVELSFRPAELAYGVAVSGFAVVVIAIVGVAGTRKRSRSDVDTEPSTPGPLGR